MKTRKYQSLLIFIFISLALLLSACQVNFITGIKNDGSGTYIQEIGFQGDEASMAGLSAEDASFCASQNEELPPGTSIRQETRNENETWCVYETPFSSLDDLKTIYSTTDTRITNISLVDGKLTYDITLDLRSDSGAPMGADIYWIVTLPGNIIENNATEQNDNTLKWKLIGGQVNDIRAVSETDNLNMGNDILWYIFGGSAFLCLCCFIPLVIGSIIFLFMRRKKAQQNQTNP